MSQTIQLIDEIDNSIRSSISHRIIETRGATTIENATCLNRKADRSIQSGLLRRIVALPSSTSRIYRARRHGLGTRIEPRSESVNFRSGLIKIPKFCKIFCQTGWRRHAKPSIKNARRASDVLDWLGSLCNFGRNRDYSTLLGFILQMVALIRMDCKYSRI